MLKCMILDRDIQALNAFVEYLEQMNAALADVRQLVKRKETPIFVREGNKIIRLKEDEILFIEGFGDYAKVYRSSGKPLLSQIPLKRFEEILDNRSFCRVYRSYIVSIPHINSIEHRRIQIGQSLIPISNSYLPTLMNVLSVQE